MKTIFGDVRQRTITKFGADVTSLQRAEHAGLESTHTSVNTWNEDHGRP